MKIWIPALGVLALVATSSPSFGWGHQGHELVGEIADRLLSDHAKHEVQSTLGFTLEVAAPWLDCVRSVKRKADGTFNYEPDRPEYRIPCTSFETATEEERMEDYVSRNWSNCPARPNHGCDEAYHFADVAIEHDHYSHDYAGTSDHDVVSGIDAALAVLKDRPAPAPFSIKDKKEALFLLAHLVGDLHQPLHVGAVYLDANGNPVSPDSGGGLDPATETAGGNFISAGSGNLHSEWDAIPSNFRANASMVRRARGVPSSAGDPDDWAAMWATDTVLAARSAFGGMTFSPDGHGHWVAHFSDRPDYRRAERKLKREQIAEAGAHLAVLLNAVWP